VALPVEEVLSVWRELERRRDELSTVSDERQLLDVEIESIRRVYARIVEEAHATDAALTASRAAIDRARAVLDRANGRLAAPPADA